MTSTLTGAFQLRKRLTTSLPSVALAASALVGGATLLSGGQAQAFSCSFGGAATPPAACTTGIWNPSNPASDKLVKFLNLPGNGQGTIDFKYIDNPPPGLSANDQWEVETKFNIGPAGNPLLPADGVSAYDYLIKIDHTVPHFPIFKDVTLSGLVAGDAKLTKDIWSTDGMGNKATFLKTLTYEPHALVFDTYYDLSSLKLDELYILDTAYPGTVAGLGSVTSYKNVFTQTCDGTCIPPVPGPLPLLGAGAAFGYTRKLRRRVKVFRMA